MDSARPWLVRGVAMAALLAAAGCAEVVEYFDSPHYPSSERGDYPSDLDYCDQIARATLHAQGEISSDIGREEQTHEHTTQGPDTLERNIGAYEERQRFQRIVADCLRERRASPPVGTSR
jgi:hypothetical protein